MSDVEKPVCTQDIDKKIKLVQRLVEQLKKPRGQSDEKESQKVKNNSEPIREGIGV